MSAAVIFIPFSKLSICSFVNEVLFLWSFLLSLSLAWSSSHGVVAVGVTDAERDVSSELKPSNESSKKNHSYQKRRIQIL